MCYNVAGRACAVRSIRSRAVITTVAVAVRLL
jgi:hypothetical protein